MSYFQDHPNKNCLVLSSMAQGTFSKLSWSLQLVLVSVIALPKRCQHLSSLQKCFGALRFPSGKSMCLTSSLSWQVKAMLYFLPPFEILLYSWVMQLSRPLKTCDLTSALYCPGDVSGAQVLWSSRFSQPSFWPRMPSGRMEEMTAGLAGSFFSSQ